MVPSLSRNMMVWTIFVEPDLRIIAAKLIWNLAIALWQEFWIFTNLCCHSYLSWNVVFMDGTYELGYNLSCGFRQTVIWKHCLSQVMDHLLVCWLENLFIEWPWPLVITEVHVLPTFISQTIIVLEKYNVPPFPIQNPKGSNLTLMKNGSGQPWVTWCYITSFRAIDKVVLEKKFFF